MANPSLNQGSNAKNAFCLTKNVLFNRRNFEAPLIAAYSEYRTKYDAAFVTDLQTRPKQQRNATAKVAKSQRLKTAFFCEKVFSALEPWFKIGFATFA